MGKNLFIRKKFFVILMTLTMVITLVSCGDKDDKDTVDPVSSVDNELVGNYKCTGSDLNGNKFDPTGEWLELKDDGTGIMFIGAMESSFDWTLSGSEISLNTMEGLSYKAEVDKNEIILNTGMLYYFIKNESSEKSESSEVDPNKEENILMGAPPAGSIKLPSDWYGVVIVEDSIGFDLEDGRYDVYGTIDKDPAGDAFFELYLEMGNDITDDAILSMYIDEKDNMVLTPIIGEDDAWIMDMYLWEDDEAGLTTTYDKGALDINYIFDYGADKYLNCRFFVREDGTGWNEEVDPLPNNYDEYAKQNYKTNNGND
ncbi:MAG: hypothetical protein GX752_02560 [Clostridium sp.]|nr:hypothetical protein [Clostridium sp.]